REVNMRLFTLIVFFTATLWGQGAGGVQFKDWTAPAATAKSAGAKAKIACGELRSLTGFELSVISASVIPAAAEVPEHCRVNLLVRNYYGAVPSKSYYDGCSQGGRQGLILAQRFPADFDGILVGAPGLDNVGTMLARAWWEKGLAANPLPVAKLNLLAQRVYE